MKKRKYDTADIVIFLILLLEAGVLFYTLFYRQCVENMLGSGLFPADMKAYILTMQGQESGYSFPYPVLFKLAAFFHLFLGAEASMALATTVLNLASIVFVKLIFNRYVKEELTRKMGGKSVLAGMVISLVSVSVFFVSMLFTSPLGIYLPGIKYNYLGVFSPNPFHNATYMAARPFAILSFFWLVALFSHYEKDRFKTLRRHSDWVEYPAFSVFLLLATMAKPSFTLVLVATAGLIMVFRLIKSRFANLEGTILLGLTFLPTFADLLYQYNGVFVPKEGEVGGIGFCFGTIWKLYCGNLFIAIVLAVGFPLLVLVLNYREIKTNALFRFSWQIYACGLATAFLLYEKGFRAPDFNFSWGYMYGIFFAFIGSLAVLLKKTVKGEKPVLLILQWGAFGCHLLCGLYYFFLIFEGRMYY